MTRRIRERTRAIRLYYARCNALLISAHSRLVSAWHPPVAIIDLLCFMSSRSAEPDTATFVYYGQGVQFSMARAKAHRSQKPLTSVQGGVSVPMYPRPEDQRRLLSRAAFLGQVEENGAISHW